MFFVIMLTVLTKLPAKRNNNSIFLVLTKSYAYSASLENRPYDLYKLKSPPSDKSVITTVEAKHYLKQMILIREIENAVPKFHEFGLQNSFCNSCVGQEACAVGLRAVIESQDTVVTPYRSGGWPVLMGATTHEVLADFLAKEPGVTKGKGGSLSIYGSQLFGKKDVEGSHVFIGSGIGLAHNYKNDGGVCFTVFGDGAINQGQVYEAYNMAMLHKLPVVYIIENNRYNSSSSVSPVTANANLYTRGDLMRGIKADGMDVLTVREATRFAREYAATVGPIVIELITYRCFRNSTSESGSYHIEEQFKKWKEKHDPITLFKEKMSKAELLTTYEIRTIETETMKQVEEAIKQAKTDEDISAMELVS